MGTEETALLTKTHAYPNYLQCLSSVCRKSQIWQAGKLLNYKIIYKVLLGHESVIEKGLLERGIP